MERVRMCPMKGTARRGRTPAEDAAIVAQLRASAKERTENIMIVDLIRNDVPRLATTGSVRVGSLCRVDRSSTVHQLTSEVTASVRPGTGLADVFRALFPCGSVTGPQAHDDGYHPRSRGRPTRDLLRGSRNRGTAGCVGSTLPSALYWSTGTAAPRPTAPAAASPGIRTRAPSMRASDQSRGA
jgi:hypothetical protein